MVFVIWSSLFLLLCAMIDLKTKSVYQSICIVNYGVAIVVKLLLKDINLKTVLLGIVLCGVFFAISFVIKEAIGQGDILILLTLTGILKVKNMLEILFLALIVCSIFSMVMLLIKKMKLKNVIPFVPFLFIGNILWIVLGGQYV